jgi:hypothetical protein
VRGRVAEDPAAAVHVDDDRQGAHAVGRPDDADRDIAPVLPPPVPPPPVLPVGPLPPVAVEPVGPVEGAEVAEPVVLGDESPSSSPPHAIRNAAEALTPAVPARTRRRETLRR